MKFKREPHHIKLNESYEVTGDMKNAASAIIRHWTMQPDNIRGNGVLCECLCSIYNMRTGENIDWTNYHVHHLNGDHTYNDVTNLVLIKVDKDVVHHNTLHSDALVSAISSVIYRKYRLPKNSKIDSSILSKFTVFDELELVDEYVRCIKLRTTRASKLESKSSNIILMKDVI